MGSITEICNQVAEAKIYVGLKNRATGEEYSVDYVKQLCQKHVDKIGLCVTVTETDYIYTNGSEKGVIVGLINYPRFPIAKHKDSIILNKIYCFFKFLYICIYL